MQSKSYRCVYTSHLASPSSLMRHLEGNLQVTCMQLVSKSQATHVNTPEFYLVGELYCSIHIAT